MQGLTLRCGSTYTSGLQHNLDLVHPKLDSGVKSFSLLERIPLGPDNVGLILLPGLGAEAVQLTWTS